MGNVQSKQFKDFDKQFTGAQLQKMRDLYLPKVGEPLTSWPYAVKTHTQEFVQFCVYKAPGYEGWQCFRVSMKGLTTGRKLQMLEQYYLAFAKDVVERCRIDNYIGALRRGGQLNDANTVVR